MIFNLNASYTIYRNITKKGYHSGFMRFTARVHSFVVKKGQIYILAERKKERHKSEFLLG